MGFGSSPAGSGPAGIDAPTTTDARIAARPQALAFDGLTLDFVRSATGGFVSVHPIDAKYFNRLRIAAGSIRSASATGQGVSNLKWIDPLTIEAFVRDQVSLISTDMIADGEITLNGIDLDLAVAGRVLFAVTYTNLHTGKTDTVTPAP
jgi:hypothetical protein